MRQPLVGRGAGFLTKAAREGARRHRRASGKPFDAQRLTQIAKRPIEYPRQAVQSHYLSGTEGSLSLPDLALWRYAGERSWHAEMTREQTVVHAADAYTRQLAHFRALIEGDAAEPLCSAEDGLRTLAATRAVLAAAA